MLAGCGGDGTTPAAEAPTTTERPNTVRDEAIRSTTTAPSTTRATVAATVATTVTTRPLSRDAQLAALVESFEKIRVGLAAAIKDDSRGDLSSVDRLELDRTGPTIILSATSIYSTDRIVRDTAWGVTKGIQTFWETKTFGSLPDVIPRFRLTVNSTRYDCPHDFMVRLAALRASREDWEATCRL